MNSDGVYNICYIPIPICVHPFNEKQQKINKEKKRIIPFSNFHPPSCSLCSF